MVEIPIIFSQTVWYELNSLTTKESRDFISQIRECIQSETCQRKISTLEPDQQKVFLRIIIQPYYQIIASLINLLGDNKALKIVAFLQKENLQQNSDFVNLTEEIKLESVTYNLEIGEEISKKVFSETTPIKIQNNYFEIAEDDFWHYLLKIEGEELDLILSLEQYNLIKKEITLPTLLIGTSGSGKTLFTIYSALKNIYQQDNNSNYQGLYLTYSPSQRRKAENIVREINRNIFNKLNCKDYLSLCKYLGQKYQVIAPNQFLSQRQITEYKFKEKFCKNRDMGKIEPQNLWQEIRHLIKGSSKAVQSEEKIISRSDYLMSKNQSIFPSDTDFNFVYDLAVKYQSWLNKENYWDELDLTHYLLSKPLAEDKKEHDEIYVDEIHKLTEIEVQLIFKLLKTETSENYLPKFFFAGEPDQNLSYSGFSWNKVKKIIVELYHKLPQWIKIREQIETKKLTKNFRTSSSIIDLSSAILNLESQKLKSENESFIQTSLVKSLAQPVIIYVSETELIERTKTFGANCAIIVYNEAERAKLASNFTEDQARILTIQESEGLEFDQVLVWNFCSSFEQEKSQNEDEIKAFEYHNLAMGINTAKTQLYFYEQVPKEIWEFPQLKDLVRVGNWDDLDTFFDSNYSQEEIGKIAEDYVNQGGEKAYEIAIELYRKIKDELGEKKVNAFLEEEQGNWGKAGDIWNELEYFDQAVSRWNEVDKKLWEAKWRSLSDEDWIKRGVYFEKRKDYNLALICYQKADYLEGELHCLTATNQWELAGDKCQEREDFEQASIYYELASEYYQQTLQLNSAVWMWTKLGKWEKVGLIWENLEQWEEAARCWQQNGQIEQSARCWEKAGKWSEAKKCWLELERWEELALCYEYEQKWLSAAKFWLKISELEKAARCYEKVNQWTKAEELWKQLGYWGCVAILRQRQEKWEEAAVAWQQANLLQLEALCYEYSQDWHKAEECWLKLKDWKKVALTSEKQEKWRQAAETWEILGEWQKSASAWQKMDENEKAAEFYEEGELWQEAENLWRNLGNWERVAQNCEKQGKWQEAAEIWQNLEQWKQAGFAWEQIEQIERAALCYEEGQHWQEAEECWRKLDNWEKLDFVCTKQGNWQKAANTWLKTNNFEKAALCYENCQDWVRAEKYWRKANNWLKVASVCEQLRKWEKAAEAYLQIDNFEKVAQCYENLQDWENAAEYWRKSCKWEKLARLCELREQWEEAAQAWLLIAEYDKAIICYEKLEDWANVAECWRKAGKWELLALFHEDEHQLEDAAYAWLQISEVEKAALCYEEAKNWAKAEECWRKLEKWEKLGIVCEYQDKWEEAAQVWYFVKNWEKAAYACLQIDDIETAAKYYERGGFTEKAAECLAKLNEH
jgi:intraflagellar transport protein 172